MLISKSEYSVTEAALSKYETAHGFTFPQEYRAFLLKYNGGETPETDFRLSGVSSDLVSFYELRDDGDGLELHEIELLVPAFLKDHLFTADEKAISKQCFDPGYVPWAGFVFLSKADEMYCRYCEYFHA